MATHRMEDGTVVRTENATKSWDEATDWDGHNQISRATGSQWEHQKLYRSKKGRYYVVHWSNWQGTRDHAEWVSPQEAARWLLTNDEALPEDLRQYQDQVEE